MTSVTAAPTATPAQSPTDAKDVAVTSMMLMADGSLADLETVVHPEAVNREAHTEPLATRGQGPAAFYATALWLRHAFAELAFDVHEVVVDGDLVVVHNTMSGRHVNPFVNYGPDGQVAEVFPPTGKRFASTQSHWLRIRDGKVIEHWANRDDIGTATQLGWIPPGPLYLLRMAWTKRRLRRGRPGPQIAS
jgi:predicted ester cyclase